MLTANSIYNSTFLGNFRIVKKALLLLFAGTLLLGCSEDTSDTNDEEQTPIELDQTNPVNVMQFIFQVANNGNYEALAPLCSPEAGSDEHVLKICEIAGNDEEHKASFVTHFADAQVLGPPRILDNRCEISFTFGPDNRTETMKLELVDGNWYLQSF